MKEMNCNLYMYGIFNPKNFKHCKLYNDLSYSKTSSIWKWKKSAETFLFMMEHSKITVSLFVINLLFFEHFHSLQEKLDVYILQTVFLYVSYLQFDICFSHTKKKLRRIFNLLVYF